jgi:hypothetical protein
MNQPSMYILQCYHVNALEVACESTTLHVSITLVILVGTVSAFSSC